MKIKLNAFKTFNKNNSLNDYCGNGRNPDN